MTDAPILSLSHASKSFGPVRALVDVSLDLYGGEAHALLGENGAGKSTLVKILAGVHRADGGELRVDAQPRVFHNPAEARDAGVAVIYQEPTLFPDLSIAENVLMGRQPLKGGRIHHPAMRARVAEILRDLVVPLDPARPVRGLSIADQQIVEIAKALSFQARVLIMDEPTAALTGQETERLFRVVRALRARGAAVLFITHRLEEAFAECQRLTIMRDGRWVDSGLTETYTVDRVVRGMVGRDVSDLYPKVPVQLGEVALDVRNLTRRGVFRDVSFTVRKGEIVGLAGLVGAGRSEVARAIFGIDPRDAGEVRVNGRPVPPLDTNAAMKAGIGLVPEDRRQQGLVMDMSIERNATLAVLKDLRKGFLMDRAREYQTASDWTSKLRLKAHRLTDAVSTLSGGNQQKVVLAKWLATGPSVLLVDEPTRGVDVGAKAEVHRTLAELAASGLAVVMISSDLPEVLGMADRILVMREGELVGEVARENASEEAVMYLATGQRPVIGGAA
ncbi:sugar ABC transporter ATP-binding protein [Deinococcus yavapaiensis]|uniref:Monosaccharide ABC transporter ATP-binding protein (CUT2 family) n=1 Tax=Deinococcus yavapaiensis KR-236 TaxID=694435 RepID=A0A318S1V2_9DEIO|nr:sugar ABC transporter ATP-binding protein [Deinococcus yavapaiensis]PYE48995.1 monosaccharide ABC transporter ATP-binding protein (CUT2 family) [Deinococcus yavapaiensis KR-236]